ncbi:phytanoyl-CoA dioxygenase family protein [Pseudoalteromonas xiamenensis]|uniref:phytanoyl-CoA dioxygenase family protein n=1 Tax=Pseudoalteromonas xiamenensis TaxID=882626 RepID=UPI0027E52CD4|nr:phytanoyl-CoA dioxygenase family protein [Pseudoalteromonas xiamenensis]WMN58946.1 phytanoyl-CoA dioxygenase family protein [Pseudoalteromonas xiamenensis]
MILSDAQRTHFVEKGFLVLKNAISPQLLSHLQQLSADLIAKKTQSPLSPDELPAIALGKRGTQQYLTRINNLFQFQPKLGISLAQSSLQAVIEQLCTTPVLSVYESLVVKHPLDIHGFDWHRDMNAAREDFVVTVGIYLDDSQAGQGALEVLSASHINDQSVCDYKNALRKGTVTSSDVEADAGDVVIHNVNLVHRSLPQTQDSYRRTIYFEFRKASLIETYPNFSPTWIQHRQQLNHFLTSEETMGQQAFTHFVNTILYREPVRFEAGEYCYEPNAT